MISDSEGRTVGALCLYCSVSEQGLLHLYIYVSDQPIGTFHLVVLLVFLPERIHVASLFISRKRLACDVF